MFETLIRGFKNAKLKIQGFKEINESNIEEALKDIRISLLEADVDYFVVQKFLKKMKEKAIGELVLTKVKHHGKVLKVTPAEHFIKICHDELCSILGEEDTSLKFSVNKPTSIMMVGLHGCGKTTTIAKLANFLKEQGKKPLLVAADIYRPAAVKQLQILGEKLSIPVFFEEGLKPPQLCKKSLEYAKENQKDTVLFDTAGRLAINEELMNELTEIKKVTEPENIILVVDGMIGQDAVRTATEFEKRLNITGIILTKMDGDARGGAAFSIREVTGKPIKFIGVGEALDKLEEFRPDGMATRILGLGDVVGLMKDFERVVDEKKAEEEAEKILKGEFNLIQFLDQIKIIKQMGPLMGIMEKMPFFSEAIPEGATVDDRVLVRIEAMIQSMTEEERLHPEIINESRIKRIAKGSGRNPLEIRDLLNKFQVMKNVMKRIGKMPSIISKIPGFRELFQLHKFKDMGLEELFPEEKSVFSGHRQMRILDKEKRRKLEKLRKLARKKSRRR